MVIIKFAIVFFSFIFSVRSHKKRGFNGTWPHRLFFFRNYVDSRQNWNKNGIKYHPKTVKD